MLPVQDYVHPGQPTKYAICRGPLNHFTIKFYIKIYNVISFHLGAIMVHMGTICSILFGHQRCCQHLRTFD